MARSAAHKPDSTRRATYQDVLAAPAHRVAEIIDGTLNLSPRPSPREARAAMRLRGVLAAFDEQGSRNRDAGREGDSESPDRRWWIIREPELHLGEDIVVPDWVGWRRERMPELPETAYVTLRPDWVCEILSDSRRRLELNDKRTVYAREGVEHLWLVDLATRTLAAFELREGEWALVANAKDDEQVGIRPFEAIKVNLGELWR